VHSRREPRVGRASGAFVCPDHASLLACEMLFPALRMDSALLISCRGSTVVLAALAASLLGPPLAAQTDPQSQRTIAMDEVRMASQAEVLAAGCGLKLNKKLRDMLRNDAAVKLSSEALSGMEEFTRTYTLSLLHRHRRGICAHALEQFGLEGRQMQGLLLQR